MNRQTSKHRTYGCSTIGTDLSIKYPYAFTHMSISPYGRDVVLAGRAGLAIVDLEFPFSPARTIPISSKWKITGVEWCPNTQHHGWVATPVSQTLLIHDLSHNTTKPMLVIKAHPTTITDVAWVPKIPSWIGTASIDPVIKIWDARRDQKPVWYFSKWEPTDLIAFNNVHMHKMASVHRNKIAVWDIRYGSSPLTVMEDAHSEDIVSISWHPDLQDTLVSAGQDRTVKQWRIKYASATEKYSHLLSHDIVSADYLPFGEGILVKQRSPDNEVLVIKDTPQFTPVHRFIGHTDTVVASSWRIQGARVGEDGKDSRDFQLVTWGEDQVMRMWSTSIKMVDAVGGNPSRLARDMQDLAPSFATNYIGPDKIMHLIEQRALPSELLLASAGGFGSQKITTMHEFDRAGNMLEGIRLVSTSEAHGEAPLSAQSQSTAEKSRDKESLATPTTARTSTADDHSSDDDDDEYGEYDFDGASGGRRKKEKGTVPDISDWREEMKVTVQERYSKSKTVSIKDTKPESRLCRLTVGIPWITRETLVLRVTFPMNYPAFPAQFGVEFMSPVFGSRAGIVEHLIGVADSCAAQGVPALDHCLYSLLKMLIPKARAKSMPHKSRSGSIKADDLERLPPPPPKLLWETVDDRISKRDLAHSAAALSRKINRFSQQDSLLPPAAGQSDSRQPKRDSVSRGTQRWTPSSLPSDGNMSAMSNDEDGDNYNGYTVSEDEHLDDGYFDKGKHSSDSSSRGSEDEEEEDDDFAMGYDGDNYEQTYYSDFSQSEIPLDNDGIPIMSRHVNSHERYDARTPFPRLCGGVFSGPGTLICFFASIYTPDTYPDPIGHGQQARGNRERTREDMYQQLRKITKPRNFYELKPYQGMVQFGLQNKGAYFSFNGGNGTTGTSGDALHMANGRKHSNGRRRSSSLSGFDDSDDDGEARDEEVPRFYYRKQISHNTFSDSDDESDAHSTYFKPVALTRVDKGVGNMALLCTVSKDRSANYELAKQFELVGQSTEWICRHNATVADLNGRKGLAHIWTMLACLLGPVLSGSDGNVSARIWSTHPPLVRWLRSVMIHYERRGDVQTLALLSCVLSKASAEASVLMGEEHSGFRAGACGHSDANAVVHDAAGVNIASNELVTGADMPPWMAAASAGAAAAAAAVGSKSSLSQISALRPKGRSRVGWDILGTSAAEAVAAAAASAAFTGNTKQMRAASQGDQLQTSPNLNPSQMAVAAQRAVSFAVPATFVSAAVSTGASAAASASASAMGVAGVTSTVEPSSTSMTSAMHVATQSQTPPPTNKLAEAAAAAAAAAASSSSGMQMSETMNMAAAEAFLGRRIAGNDDAQRFSMLFSTNQMSLVPQHTDGSTAPVLYNGMPASIDPLSPEILQELDSEEIKQNEMMMAEGLDDLHALLTREPTPDSSAPVTGNSETGHMSLDNHAGNAGDEPEACADSQQRSSSEHVNERSSAEPDTAENLWKRLRSNVLGRVQTAAPAGTKPGSLEMASSPPSVAAAHTTQPITEAVSPDMVAKAKAKVKPKASTRGNSAKHGKSWLMTHNWVPLLSGKEGVAAQAVAKELAYLRTKREFERLHTRLVMRDRSEWADDDGITFGSNSSDYRMQAPYLDHWKLLYARDLYKWNMNIKAVEVLKCVQDPVLREFYNQMYCQPTVPVHDNLPRIANPVISGRNNQEKEAEAEAEAEAVKRPRAVSEAEEFRSDVGTESGTDTTMEIGGAPWLACAWCHEYVHGCALICHACGHGGHQEHMQRWFGIVRKQLLRTGLAPARYSRTGATVNNSNSSSTSNLQRGVSSSSMGQKKLTFSAVANSGHLAVGSNVTASDYLSSFVNSPVAGPSEAIAPISSVLPDLNITEPSSDAAQKRPGPDIEIIAAASSSIGSSSSSSSSSDDGENVRGTSNGNSPGSATSNAYSLFTPMQYDHIVSVKQNGWESSEGESDDHLHFPQDNVLLMSGLGGTKLRRLRKTVPLTPQNSQNGVENVHEDAFRMQLDIPTCPSGCGCNCLYETRRAIL